MDRVANNENAVVLDGGARMRLRDAHRGDISAEQVELFFATLAETCNVVRAARAAGFSSNWAYRKRRRDAGFRNGWATAVREGYAKLELVLLERAMKGIAKTHVGRDGSERIIREYSTALAVALLRRHADTADEAGYEHHADDLRETRERILEKLERLRIRDGGADSPLTLPPLRGGPLPLPQRGEGLSGDAVVETKSARSRIEIIRWGLAKRCTPAKAGVQTGSLPSQGHKTTA